MNSPNPAESSTAGPAAALKTCFHCGEPCPDGRHSHGEKTFCCQGCLFVHDLLTQTGLDNFYELNRHPGVQVRAATKREQYAYLDDPAVEQRLVDFTDGHLSRVTFHIPAIHCVACVWLLENLFRLHPGIGRSRVNFSQREVSIAFAPAKILLSEVAALVASLGYLPRITLDHLEKRDVDSDRKHQWLKIGIAGFAFGNIMLFSLPLYLGLDSLSGPLFRKVFGALSLLLALPVMVYSASDYWRSALVSARMKLLTLDVPIALGLAALYGQSAWEILTGTGEGYLDSLAGLVFLLLCGRAFQQKTHDRIVFDRDYRSFFPLGALRRTTAGDEVAAISSLQVGDRLLLRNAELLPADARLISDTASIDYSFVTGESEPVVRRAGELLYAGGRQVGRSIEVQTVKPVSQSYLSELWKHETFSRKADDGLHSLTNRYSRRFTWVVVGIAAAAAVCWAFAGDAARGLKAFTSVLIVACPCALALAAPFTLGTAQRLLARRQVFLKDGQSLERMAAVDCVVFDKTGTLTSPRETAVAFESAIPLSGSERQQVASLAAHSIHPHSVNILRWLGVETSPNGVEGFREVSGCGIEGKAGNALIRLGSAAWLAEDGIQVPVTVGKSNVCLAMDQRFRGSFQVTHPLHPDAAGLLNRLRHRFRTVLLSGDNERERERLAPLFGHAADVLFNQEPVQKLEFVRSLQASGKKVLMVGDGLNDAGALKQSDVGAAVIENTGSFSPASDVILPSSQLGRLDSVLELARSAARIVRLSFGISALYNFVGITIGAAGLLSPLTCAVLMPVSSISVVLFACGATRHAARKAGVTE